jgi:hypothetical protein
MGGSVGVNVRHKDREGKIVETLMMRWTNSLWQTWSVDFLNQGESMYKYLDQATFDGDWSRERHSSIDDPEYGHVCLDLTTMPIQVFSHQGYTTWGQLHATTFSTGFWWQISDIYMWLLKDPTCVSEFTEFGRGYDGEPPKSLTSQQAFELLKPFEKVLLNPDLAEEVSGNKEHPDFPLLAGLFQAWQPYEMCYGQLLPSIAIIDHGDRPDKATVEAWLREHGWTSPMGEWEADEDDEEVSDDDTGA